MAAGAPVEDPPKGDAAVELPPKAKMLLEVEPVPPGATVPVAEAAPKVKELEIAGLAAEDPKANVSLAVVVGLLVFCIVLA